MCRPIRQGIALVRPAPLATLPRAHVLPAEGGLRSRVSSAACLLIVVDEARSGPPPGAHRSVGRSSARQALASMSRKDLAAATRARTRRARAFVRVDDNLQRSGTWSPTYDGRSAPWWLNRASRLGADAADRKRVRALADAGDRRRHSPRSTFTARRCGANWRSTRARGACTSPIRDTCFRKPHVAPRRSVAGACLAPARRRQLVARRARRWSSGLQGPRVHRRAGAIRRCDEKTLRQRVAQLVGALRRATAHARPDSSASSSAR